MRLSSTARRLGSRVDSRAQRQRPREPRLESAVVEVLEQRRLLSAGQWYAVVGGMAPGATLDQQLEHGRSLLRSSGLTSGIQVVEALDLSGTFRIETSTTGTQEQVAERLRQVPGFIYVDEWNESDVAAMRKVQPAAGRSEGLFGPFNYDDFLSRQKNGEFPDQGGQVGADPYNALTNNNGGATGTGLFTQSETAIIAWDNHVVVAFNDSGSNSGGTNKFTGWAHSSDGGVTFTDGGTLPSSVVGDAGDPVLARDAVTGRVYLSTLGFSGAGTIQMWRSDDNGVSRQAPVNATPGGSSEDKQ